MATEVDDAQVRDVTRKMENANLRSETGRDRGRYNRYPSDEEVEELYAEKLKGLKIVQSKVTGKVKWYSVLRHFGFIECDGGADDVFVHQYSIVESRTRRRCYRTLEDGESVEFDIAEGDKGREAVNVAGPDRGPVVGSRYQMLQAPWMRRAFFQHRQALNSRNGDGPRRNGKADEGKSKDESKSNTKEKKGKGRREPNRRRSPRKSDAGKKHNGDRQSGAGGSEAESETGSVIVKVDVRGAGDSKAKINN